MPFDVATETPAIRRARLIEALRGNMPPNHEWNFTFSYEERGCGTAGCAIGVAIRLGIIENTHPFDRYDHIKERLGLSDHQMSVFRSDGAGPYGVLATAVTPGMVAEALEKIGG
jgi:hypothetical protein